MPKTSDPRPEERPTALVDHFFRHEYGRLVAQLVRRFGAQHLQSIEDSVQHAMLRALEVWSRRGLPPHPGAWLATVSKNNLIDRFRREGKHHDWNADAESQADAELQNSSEDQANGLRLESEIHDDLLRMLFVCCDPDLPPESQLVLALKILCGFSTKEIALRLFIREDNVQKRLSRGRSKLRKIANEAPSPSSPLPEAPNDFLSPKHCEQRLSSVLRVLYLLFNEGYHSQRHNEPIVRELCEEALRLGILVTQSEFATPSAWALRAMMHFHCARIDARCDGAGGVFLLSEQKRELWKGGEIRQGLLCLSKSAKGDHFSRYHAQAAILAQHCLAPSYEETNWSEIVQLYELLEGFEPSPLYTLNRAIAVGEWKGPRAGLEVLASREPPGWLGRYYLWDATVGELLRRDGQREQAQVHLQRALKLAPEGPDQRLIAQRLADCRKAKR